MYLTQGLHRARLRDVIVTNGHNVYSAEVENALASHPAVASCAVIAVPDGKRGERVHAVIVREPETAAPDIDELQRHCLRTIAAYKVPRSCEFVDALPLSPIGKPLKRKLREPYWSGMDRQVS
jgi:acyl-CoA synthetase (AMP-forming)/AMP-acid ligase II